MRATENLLSLLILGSSFDTGESRSMPNLRSRQSWGTEIAGRGYTGLGSASITGLSIPSKRATATCPPGMIMVYNFPNSDRGFATLCASGWVVASCTLVAAIGSFSGLAWWVASMIKGKSTDASNAGPQAGSSKSSAVELADFYNSTGTYPYNDTTSGQLTDAGINKAMTSLIVDEDSFSASFNLSALPTNAPPTEVARSGPGKRSSCREQVHVHYWAARGHDSTALSRNDVYDLAFHALDDSYKKRYKFSCYRMHNNGKWVGWLRICYNDNSPQRGCGRCGGHNN